MRTKSRRKRSKRKSSRKKKEKLTYPSFTLSPSKPKGLKNLGNTCFMNSILQVLFHTPNFLELLKTVPTNFLSKTEVPEVKKPKRRTRLKSVDLSTQINSLKEEEKKPSNLLNLIQLVADYNNQELRNNFLVPSKMQSLCYSMPILFSPFEQHDSHEYLLAFLDQIYNEIFELGQGKKTQNFFFPLIKKFQDFFEGELISQVICGRCRHRSQVNENFRVLSLVRMKKNKNLRI